MIKKLKLQGENMLSFDLENLEKKTQKRVHRDEQAANKAIALTTTIAAIIGVVLIVIIVILSTTDWLPWTMSFNSKVAK
jgi:hypothetical protein